MKTLNLKYFGVRIFIFMGHVTSSVTWPLDSPYVVSYWWSIVTMRLSCMDTEISGFKNLGVTSLTFWGHVTSSVTWPLDLPYVISYWRFIVTMHLSCTVTEIWGPKDIGVRTLTFWGHVMSSEHDHRTRREHFPIGSQWWLWIYLAQIRRYGASKILGSRVWPFGVTRRHRSRDH